MVRARGLRVQHRVQVLSENGIGFVLSSGVFYDNPLYILNVQGESNASYEAERETVHLVMVVSVFGIGFGR